jgi:ABC-type bacteriocin/lantibiotic exporter with double-glycine peptidase domain
MLNELRFEKILENSLDQPINIELENLCFSYKNGKQVFDGIDFIARSGETVALVGPSGEGKTTLLRILLGIVTKTSGKAVVYQEGQENDEVIIDPSIRKLISYVPQGNTLMSGTIAENMRMVNKAATDKEIISALKDACAFEFVNKLESGIDYETKESGNSFSEGQNQRLAIARALLCKSPILLLDEATSALDIVTERQVLKNIAKGHSNRICILTTHRPTVLGICDRVYRIADKKISIITEEQVTQLMNDF